MKAYEHFRFFYNPSPFAESHLMVSDGMGYEAHGTFLIDREYFDNYVVMYVLKGTLYVEQFRKQWQIKPGEGILMSLHHKHKYYFDKKEESVVIWFHFRGKPCESLILELDHHYQMPVVFDRPGLETGIFELFEATKDWSRQSEYILSQKLYQTVTELLKPSLMKIQETEPNSTLAYEVACYIQQHIDEAFDLTEMARTFNMSKYHFCRAFKQQWGCGLFEYIKNEKIALAKKMLLSTNDSIAEIANALSFCDQGYFSTTFKSVVGCTPKFYRNNHQSKE